MNVKLRIIYIMAAVAVFVSIAVMRSTAAQEVSKDILAAQVRDQGYECSKPVSARKDSARSRPDEEVWILNCERNAYRVRLDPDMAAHIERLD